MRPSGADRTTDHRTHPPRPHWLASVGFERVHTPGIARAWRMDLEDGYILITDLGGFDLPEPGGPASAYVFSTADEVLEFEECLEDSRALFGWIDSARRRSLRRVRGGPGEPGAGEPSR